MKILNYTKYLITLSVAVILFSSAIHAAPNCWSAGILDGMCYQQPTQKQPTNNQEQTRTKYSSVKCWTAGAFNGMCYTDTNSKQSTIENPTEYSSQCWTAGVLNGMCY